MKGPNYLMRIMDTGGHLWAYDTCKETVIRWKENGKYFMKKLKYKVPFDWHFCCLHAVNNHNNLRHSLPPIEDICMKYWWECWVFDFIFSILEDNTVFIQRYFVYYGLRREGSFFGSWRGNSLTIYALGDWRGG